jgi:SAM-dependent methyltransferase
MGTAISKAHNGLHHDHTTSAADSTDAATATAIIAAVNEQQLAHLLPPLIAALDDKDATEENASSGGPLFVLDLDCGAGHNTLTLAHLTHNWRIPVQLEGWDRNWEKLEIAQARCKDVRWENTNSSVTFSKANHWRRLEIGHPVLKYFRHMYEFVLSTLVINHMPLDVFFKGIEGLLSRDSVALVTCMHPEVGPAGHSSTGNQDEKTEMGGESGFRRSVQEVLKVARECGLTLQGAVNEVKLSSTMVEGLEESLRGDARKWIGRKVWFSVVLRRVTDAKF